MSKTKRNLVAQKCDWHCAYCGVELNNTSLVVDHVIPKFDNGSNDISNLLPSCRSCNSTKGIKTLEQFRFYTEFRNAVPNTNFSQSQMEFLKQKSVLSFLGNFEKHIFYFEKLQQKQAVVQ